MSPISCWSIHYSAPHCTFTVVRIYKRLILNRRLHTGKPLLLIIIVISHIHGHNWLIETLFFSICNLVLSALGSALFSLGSVLVWAIIRSSIPHNAALGTVVGLASGYGIARLSYEYLKHVDAVAAGQGKKAIESS